MNVFLGLQTPIRWVMLSLFSMLAASPATLTPATPVFQFSSDMNRGDTLSRAVVQLAPGFTPEPYLLSGVSGGTENSKDCGQIPPNPDHEIQLIADFPYLRFQVETPGGSPTLLIEGPAGRFCLLPAQPGAEAVELAGYMPQGVYTINIGNRGSTPLNYTLTISQQP